MAFLLVSFDCDRRKVCPVSLQAFYGLFTRWVFRKKSNSCARFMDVCNLFPISSNYLRENDRGKGMPMQWQWTNTMQTLEIMQSESASITLIFQRLGMFYHSITGSTSPFFNCIMLKTLNQSYRQDRVYIGVRRNSLAVQNAQLMTQVTRQCPCIVFHQLSGHAASQRGEDTEYRARRRWMRPPRVAGDTLPCDVQ